MKFNFASHKPCFYPNISILSFLFKIETAGRFERAYKWIATLKRKLKVVLILSVKPP